MKENYKQLKYLVDTTIKEADEKMALIRERHAELKH